MAAKKRTSNSDKEAYARYERESRWAVNRRRKLNRHLKKQPNDTVAAKALDNISYRRRKPTTRLWRGTRKAEAQLLASFKLKQGDTITKQRRFKPTIRDALV